MHLISKILRYLLRQWELLLYKLRIVKLKMLYPGICIDFKTQIEKNCSVICVKGGNLTILNSHISFGTHIKADKGSLISIHNSFVGRNCVIASKEQIMISDNCLIAEMVVIRDQDHMIDYTSRNSFITSPIKIEKNVWIGAKASILKGVTIGKNSVVAASALVTKDIPQREVWGGIPARFIKRISKEMAVVSDSPTIN